jgi:pimeloyl-ACP methyl ester carboxylesterase
LLISVWTLVVERTVLWGKREEEERLTGRPESRRTLLEWTEVLFSTIGLLTIGLVTILLSLNLFLRAVDASLAPVGTRYWVNGDRYQIHIYCHGKKTDRSGQVFPTVLIEGGEVPVENGLWQFADNAIKNGSILRYCFSDRPGWGWVSQKSQASALHYPVADNEQSDDAPSPLTAGMAVDALSEALTHAAEDGPWILLSAGIGSIYSRVFAARHGSDVRGLVLVDPLHEDLLYRVASPKRGFLLWFKGFIAPLGLETLPGALFKGRSKEDRTWGRSAGLSGKTIFAKLQESLVADSFTKNDVTSARAIQDPDTPVVLISSGQEVRRDHEWSEGQRDLSKLTRNVKHWDIVDKAPHQVWETAEGRDQMEKRLSKLVFAERRDGRPPGPREGLEMLE